VGVSNLSGSSRRTRRSGGLGRSNRLGVRSRRCTFLNGSVLSEILTGIVHFWTLIPREVITSTSDLARELVVEGRTALPFVVVANQQTRGRGRGRNAWWSDAGSLTFTIALDPAAHGLRAEHEPRLALAAAVAVVDAIAPLLPEGRAPGIRWPNDVEVVGRKLGGILPERIETDRGPRLLVGIGVNVRTRLALAPPEIQRMATSVEIERGVAMTEAETAKLLETILDRCAAMMGALARDDGGLAERWGQLDSLRGQWVRVDLGSQIVAGLGHGIDAAGRLVLLGAGGPMPIVGGQVLREAE
jgi:BirA family biotin operon repressor/biotin-[acetyl-CoA-carboxylase] ligase